MNRGFDKETPLQKVYSLFIFWDTCKYKVCKVLLSELACWIETWEYELEWVWLMSLVSHKQILELDNDLILQLKC